MPKLVAGGGVYAGALCGGIDGGVYDGAGPRHAAMGATGALHGAALRDQDGGAGGAVMGATRGGSYPLRTAEAGAS